MLIVKVKQILCTITLCCYLEKYIMQWILKLFKKCVTIKPHLINLTKEIFSVVISISIVYTGIMMCAWFIQNFSSDENQKMCGLQLPFIMSLFEKHRDEPLLGRPLMFLLVFVVSNNSEYNSSNSFDRSLCKYITLSPLH